MFNFLNWNGTIELLKGFASGQLRPAFSPTKSEAQKSRLVMGEGVIKSDVCMVFYSLIKCQIEHHMIMPREVSWQTHVVVEGQFP